MQASRRRRTASSSKSGYPLSGVTVLETAMLSCNLILRAPRAFVTIRSLDAVALECEDSVLQYQTVLAADNFLVMVHGPADEISHAKAIMGSASPTQITVHVAPVGGTVESGLPAVA